jgi:hypothetical protein
MSSLNLENQKKNILLLFAVGTFGLNLLSLVLLFFHGAILQQLDGRLTPQSLVELVGGRTITADPEADLERQPETIRRFVGEAMTLMLTSSPQQPPETVQDISSALLADEFKPKFQAGIPPLHRTIRSASGNKNVEHVLVVGRISQPTKIGEGRWKVQMLAYQLIFSNSDLLGQSISVNKQILVRSINKQAMLLPDRPNPLQLATYHLGEARLQIYNICPLQEKNCS